MGLLGKLFGKENVKFPSSRDVERNEARDDRRAWKQEQKEAYREEFRKARLERLRGDARKAGSTNLSDRLNRMASPPSSSQRVYRQPAKRYSTTNNYNPFGNMFDSGMDISPMSTRAAKRYAVVGGKAYPIAGKGKKKKKRRKSGGSGLAFSGFDMTDNWGLMK